MSATMHRCTLVACAVMLVALTLAIAAPALARAVPVTPEEQAHIEEIRLAIEEKGAHWTAGPTSKSHLYPDELSALCGILVTEEERAIYDATVLDVIEQSGPLRSAFDWRDSGGVSSVKNQGGCGSCWAFGACGVTESQILIHEGIELDLSEQQGLDCNTDGGTCSGGLESYAWHVHECPGAVLESCLPYQATETACVQYECSKVVYSDSWAYLATGVANIKNAVQTYGPVTSHMDVYEDFDAYVSGCYEHVTGEYRGRHSVNIIGWDDSMCGGTGAWICKNSWGTNWGLDGFFYIKYGDSDIGSWPQAVYGVRTPGMVQVPGDYSTIGAAWANSSLGDTIEIAGGTYAEHLLIGSYGGRQLLGGYDPTFTVRDPELYPTTINGGTEEAIDGGTWNLCSFIVDGIELTSSSTAKPVIDTRSMETTISNCKVSGGSNGLVIANTGVAGLISIEGCEVVGASDVGIYPLTASGLAVLDIRNNLVRDCDKGVDLYHYNSGQTTLFSGNTVVSNNRGVNAQVNVSPSDCVIRNNIFASNTIDGIRSTGTIAAPITYSDAWDNNYNYPDCSVGTGCISLDPVFCDAGGNDYSLHGSSPCLGAGASGADMGVYGVGCPTGPQNLSVAQNGASVDVTWDAPAWRNEVDYYVLYRDTDPDPADVLALVPAGETAFTDISIPPCQTCYYQVSCVDTSGYEGMKSDIESGELCYNTTAALAATFDPGGNLLSWTEAGGPVDYYLIRRGRGLAALDSLTTVSTPDTTYTDTDTSECPSDNYTYEVTPIYDTGWPGVVSNQVELDPSPAAPSGLTAEWSGTDAVLTWNPACESDFNTYRVYRDTAPMPPPPDSELLVGLPDDTTFVDTGLNTDLVYFYRVTSVDESNQASGYSGIAYVGQGQILPVPSPYATIQSAIDAASAIDTVLVSPGTYNENITLKDGVLVMSSDGRAITTISSGSGAVVTSVGRGDLTLLDGFTIDGQGTAQYGLDSWTSYLRVENCSFVNSNSGANFRYGDKSTLTGNSFTSNSNGIAVADSGRPFLKNNVIELNTFTGIYNTGVPGPEVGRTLDDANDIKNNALFEVFNLTAGTVDADYNYWGNDCVGDSMFYGLVDYVPWTDETHTETYTECGTGLWDVEVAGRVILGNNFPNPFNPNTTIGYSVPTPGGYVKLSVYDLSGRKVRTLVDAPTGPGEYTVSWRGRDDRGHELGSGAYFYRLEVGDTRIERKMVLLK